MHSEMTATLQVANADSPEARADELLARMGLDEKIGQMAQLQTAGGHVPEWLADEIRRGGPVAAGLLVAPILHLVPEPRVAAVAPHRFRGAGDPREAQGRRAAATLVEDSTVRG